MFSLSIWSGGVGGPCDFSVSPSPFGLDFGTLDLDFGLGLDNDKLLLEHVVLPHVLVLAVHLVNFFSWMSQGGHSEQIIFFALFYQSTPSCLKVRGGWWGGVGWWPM